MDDNKLINEAYQSKMKKEPISEAKLDPEERFYIRAFSEEAEQFAGSIASACYTHFHDDDAGFVFDRIRTAVIKTLNSLDIESFENPYGEEGEDY